MAGQPLGLVLKSVGEAGHGLWEEKRERGGDPCNRSRRWKVKTTFFNPLKDTLMICKFISMKIIAKINKFNHTELYI